MTDIVIQLRQYAKNQRDRAPEGATLWIADAFDRAADEIERLRRWQLSCTERAAIDRVMNRMLILATDGRTWPEIETFRKMVERFPVSYQEINEKCDVSHIAGATND